MGNAVPLRDQFAFGYINNLGDAFSKLVPVGLVVAMVAVLFYLLVGAMRLILSGGNKESVASARAMITHAIIAFILLIFAFLILQIIPAAFNLTGFKIIR